MDDTPQLDYTFDLVQVHIPQPVQLVMLRPKQLPNNPRLCHTMVLVKQLYEVLQLQQTCTYQHFQQHARQGSRSTLVRGADLAVLHRLEAASPNAHVVKAITCVQAIKVMKHFKVPPPQLAAMTAMRLNSISMDRLPIPEHVLFPSPMAQPCPRQVQAKEPFPRTLPE